MEKLTRSPKNYIQGLLKIKSEGQIKDFRFNEVQNKVYSIIRKIQLEGKPVRAVILKARQTGISTLTEALIFYNTVTRANTSSLIIAHNKISTQNIFRMSKLFYDRMDSKFKPMKSAGNKNELYFDNPSEKSRHRSPGLNSYIYVDTAGNPDAGRSFALQNLHISEIAMWEKAEEIMAGLKPTVKYRPNTMIVIESTAKGVGNYFHNLWLNTEAGKNEYTPIFIAWFELDSYRMLPPKDFKPYDYEHELYGNEARLAETFELDKEQLAWRRFTIRNECDNDPQKFKQEYPSTPLEAFLTSGRKIFNNETISDYYQHVKEPQRGELTDVISIQPEG
jgi:hypothetical protein